MLTNPDIISNNQWPHNVTLLRVVRCNGCKTALATMSTCSQANYILHVLHLMEYFDFIATIDDEENGKPDPEIYHLIANELIVHPSECLVIEDSLSGLKAALNAGMQCVAVTTPFSVTSIHSSKLLDEQYIVDDPKTLLSVVQNIFAKTM